MRENAGNWLELGAKVYHYRRDVLTPTQVGELQSRMAELFVVKRGEDFVIVRIVIEPFPEPHGRRDLAEQNIDAAPLAQISSEPDGLDPDPHAVVGFDRIHEVFYFDHGDRLLV